jgi:hypothetical protein
MRKHHGLSGWCNSFVGSTTPMGCGLLRPCLARGADHARRHCVSRGVLARAVRDLRPGGDRSKAKRGPPHAGQPFRSEGRERLP